MDEARLRSVKQQIEEAFKDAPYPGDHEMVTDPNDWESIDLMNAFKGKHWKELDAETLRRNHDTFLSIAGLQYYFPAYLMAALDDVEDILPFTVYGLYFSEDPRLRQRDLERFNSFTPAQKKAIKAFLEYVRDQYPECWSLRDPEPVRALRDYWGQVDRE
jgi:hypothetical protein